MFLYHAGLERERMLLKAPEMRSTHGGALRQASTVRADKPLRGHHAASKKQQVELCRLALVRAFAVDRKRYFERGLLSLVQLHWEERQAQEKFRRASAARKLRAQTQTCAVCPGGRKRKVVAPPEAFMYLLNPLLPIGASAPKTARGTGYGNDALKVKRKTNGKRKAVAAPPLSSKIQKVKKNGQRLGPTLLRKAAAPKPLPALKRPRKQPQRKAAVAAVLTMDEQLAAAAQAEAEAEVQEARLQAEAEAAAQQLEQRRVETLRSLVEHRERVAAEAAAAEAARAAATAAVQESAERSQVRELQRIEEQVKAFYVAFKKQHGRSPKPADLECAVNIRMKVVVERYHLLKHGQAPRGLQGGRDRSRVFGHQY
jgi:hypothetical protein